MYNTVETFAKTSLFAAFLDEALTFVNVSTATDINSGGCGIFAKMLITKLKQFGIEATPIILSRVDERLTNRFIETNGMSGDNIGLHIVVEVDKTFIVDSQGIRNGAYRINKGSYPITEEKLDQLLSSNIWNAMFEKSEVPYIQAAMDKTFSSMYDFVPGMFEFPDDRAKLLIRQRLEEKRSPEDDFMAWLGGMIASN